MTRALLSHIVRPGADTPAEPPLSLADLVTALCAGLMPLHGIEALLDRVEGRA